ncbi:polyketide synthase, partial [Burkholderia ubonensis]
AAFDARADGYVRAEGCVVMVLKRLADARADGDAIHAVIRGSAINHDGRSSGLTAPNGRAQERVMRAALRDAGVDAREVALVEAHGTGTALGDPIEYHALRAVYADETPRATPLVLGALKSFVGHTEAASGLAGLLKLVLSLRARTAPAQLHYATLNPFIDASERIEIPRAARALAGADAGRLLGAVSAFGFNGTNAHVIVERGDDRPSRRLAGEPFARV